VGHSLNSLSNNGITVLVDEMSFDRASEDDGIITATLSDPERHGIANGGHTFTAIREVARVTNRSVSIAIARNGRGRKGNTSKYSSGSDRLIVCAHRFSASDMIRFGTRLSLPDATAVSSVGSWQFHAYYGCCRGGMDQSRS
jgi:hypothetical protein